MAAIARTVLDQDHDSRVKSFISCPTEGTGAQKRRPSSTLFPRMLPGRSIGSEEAGN